MEFDVLGLTHKAFKPPNISTCPSFSLFHFFWKLPFFLSLSHFRKKKHPDNYWALMSGGWPQVWMKVTAVAVKHIVITKTLRNSPAFPSACSAHCKSRNAGLGFLVFLSIHHWASITGTQTSSSRAKGGLPLRVQEARAQWRAAGREERMKGGGWAREIVRQRGKWTKGKKDMQTEFQRKNRMKHSPPMFLLSPSG